MIKHYKLEGKTIVECDLLEWAAWYETANRHVALETIWGIRVSTVFLGLDHRFLFDEGAPILFETMVFVGGWSDDEMRRYCTYEEAEEGHKEIVANIKRHPWSRIVLPRIRFYASKMRSKLIEMGNKILARIWPTVIWIKSKWR